MGVLAFARPRPSPQKANLGFGGREGGSTKIQIFSQKPAHPSKLASFVSSPTQRALGCMQQGRLALFLCALCCNCGFVETQQADPNGPVSNPSSSLKWAFWPFARPRPSPQPIWDLRREGGGGGPPKFRFSAKHQAPPPLQSVFLAFWRAWARVANPKIKFVI